MDPIEPQNIERGVEAESAMVSNGAMSAEEKELREQEWRAELAKTEEEVNTLKQVLASKQLRVQELRHNLGITVVGTISKDVKDSFNRLSESEVVQKANQALKSAGERTSAAFNTVGKKLEEVKNSEFVKSVEERVGHAYDSVKRSTSLFAIEAESKVGGATSKSAATTPGSDETKPVVNSE